MHPGEESSGGDPNAAFCVHGTYHLHYILRYPPEKESFSFVHVTSRDMLHWKWHETTLQPSFTGHGMYSGTGFITREGRPAVIYHGKGSGKNHIAIAKNFDLSDWEEPYPVEPRTVDGNVAEMKHWDPDCFTIGDTYYALSGGQNPPLLRSADLRNWTHIGDFLHHDQSDVAVGEDISCPNFFPIGDKWMLLCISHPFGCRYYLGDWDAEGEQFVPESHGRMNWRRSDQSLSNPGYRDFFAPESVGTPDGRRVMWAWLATLNKALGKKKIQSLPRELSLGNDGRLRIRPLRELEALRHDEVVLNNLTIAPDGWDGKAKLTELDGDAFEIKITVDREAAKSKRFGLYLFADGQHEGLPVMIRPESGTISVGTAEAPFAVEDLPDGDDVELRIFVDKYLVEVFVNDRQAVVSAYMDHDEANEVIGYTFGPATTMTIREVRIWRLRSANQGYIEARANRVWEPKT